MLKNDRHGYFSDSSGRPVRPTGSAADVAVNEVDAAGLEARDGQLAAAALQVVKCDDMVVGPGALQRQRKCRTDESGTARDENPGSHGRESIAEGRC